MPKKKRQSQTERRAQEKQRRIEAAGKPKQAPVPKKPAPEPAEPEAKPEKPRKAPSRTPRPKQAPMPVSNPQYKTLQFGEGTDAGGDCRRYEVSFPPRMDVQALFDAIRKERRDERGTVYISLNLAEAGVSNYQLSYAYAGGMFTRREQPSRDKKAPLLADLLGRPIQKIVASGGWGAMDYFVNICGAAAAPEPSEEPGGGIG